MAVLAASHLGFWRSSPDSAAMLEDDKEGPGVKRHASLRLLHIMRCLLDGLQGAEYDLSQELVDL